MKHIISDNNANTHYIQTYNQLVTKQTHTLLIIVLFECQYNIYWPQKRTLQFVLNVVECINLMMIINAFNNVYYKLFDKYTFSIFALYILWSLCVILALKYNFDQYILHLMNQTINWYEYVQYNQIHNQLVTITISIIFKHSWIEMSMYNIIKCIFISIN